MRQISSWEASWWRPRARSLWTLRPAGYPGKGAINSEMGAHAATLIPSHQRGNSRVAIRRVGSYQSEMVAPMVETLREFDLPIRGKTILFKPNFVGPDPLNQINTHPAVVAAARESFLQLGAERVLLGDGPALDRDTEGVVESMRLREYVGPLSHCLVDLNLRRAAKSDPADQCVNAEAALPSGNRAGRGPRGFHAANENAPLGGRDAVDEKHVRHRSGKLLRLAKKYSALGGNHASDSGH